MEMICNACRKRTKILELNKRMEGDLEIQYITCSTCGQEYIVSLTDQALRVSLEEYDRLRKVIKAGNAPVGTYHKVEQLHKENTKRCQQLIQAYLGLE